MDSTVADHFSAIAAQYARFRPHYPAELFEWLAAQCRGHELAWDVGTGNGQAALGLAGFFERVAASDQSDAQLAQAAPNPRITYRHSEAEDSGLADASVDLVTVAQALHWFNLKSFYPEVKRVLRPGGVIAVWTYGMLEVEGEAPNALVYDFYRNRIRSWWPPERHHVDTAYRELEFPFEPIAPPMIKLRAQWSLAQLTGYLRSWSATARYMAERGVDPVIELEAALAPVWGAPEAAREITWPLALRVGRV